MVLVADCGTQRMKVMVFDAGGKILAKRTHEYSPTYVSPRPGWAERDPDYYWEVFLKLAGDLISDGFKDIEGISVTTQRNSLVFVDSNGKPLRPAILWLDHRRADFDLKLPLFREMLYRSIGMWRSIVSVYRDAKVNWIRQNEPDVWRRTHKVLQISGYFLWKLTGRFVDSVASQVGHIPFDYKRRKWADERDLKSFLFPVNRERLPELVEAGTVVGRLRREVAHELGIEPVPVVASGSDKGCETLGLGVVNESAASLSFGTTATVQTTTSRYFEPLKFIPPYPSLIPGMYNPEVEIFRGFWLVSWFRDEFGHLEKERASKINQSVEKLLDSLLDHAPPGSMGLVAQPYWTPGLKMPEARGAIVGFSSHHGREHVYRSLIEGIMYGLRDGAERIERSGRLSFERVAVGGGASASDRICQIAADVLNLPVYRERTGEAAGLGAAMAVYVGLGVHSSFEEAVKEMVEYSDVFEPDRENAGLYDEIYRRVYRKLYKRLRKLYRELEDILK